ncbi:hypothetical protein CHS0354_040091 [Potamilus streckersoni]|uniref:Fucolectin tachylectin-4 pentraxin-1 domain-containing protein n=1 Tax=Potamilus streckersoni TaxID=2493646 RepID=A0AAE0SU56_9BIVA|nr:hypothetical protein CHS0354_040091 [Potamilus streckersoni]
MLIGFQNFALNKHAYQSSVIDYNNFNWTADKAVDGNTDGSEPEVSRTCSATMERYDNHTWEVDIGFMISVQTVTVYERSDASDQLSGFQVFLGNITSPWTVNQPLVENQREHSRHTFIAYGSLAQFVSVIRQNSDILTICEVVVEGGKNILFMCLYSACKDNMAINVMQPVAIVYPATVVVTPQMVNAWMDAKQDGRVQRVKRSACKENMAINVLQPVAIVYPATVVVTPQMVNAWMDAKQDGRVQRVKKAVVKEHTAMDAMKLVACALTETTAVQRLMDIVKSAVNLDGREELVNKHATKEHTGTDVTKLVACVLTGAIAVQSLMDSARMVVRLDGWEKHVRRV